MTARAHLRIYASMHLRIYTSTHLRIYRQGIACRALSTGINFQPHRLTKALNEWHEEELRLYECSVMDGMI